MRWRAQQVNRSKNPWLLAQHPSLKHIHGATASSSDVMACQAPTRHPLPSPSPPRPQQHLKSCHRINFSVAAITSPASRFSSAHSLCSSEGVSSFSVYIKAIRLLFLLFPNFSLKLIHLLSAFLSLISPLPWPLFAPLKRLWNSFLSHFSIFPTSLRPQPHILINCLP